jgi:O-antigen/teichoic acid export membrane protein
MSVAPDSADLAGRAIRGSFYGVGAAMVTLPLGFLRAVLLARLLLPEHFGLVALAFFYIGLSVQLRAANLSAAWVHHPHPDETLLRTYFSLRFGMTAVSLVLLVVAIPLLLPFYPTMPLLGWVILSLAGAEVLRTLAFVQDSLLSRAMAFRAAAIADVAASVVMVCVAPALAWFGWGVWALVGEAVSGLLARTLYVWVTRPETRPRFGWDGPAARWFWEYARPSWAASNLTFLREGFDDFWVGTFLGKEALGYYSRAYEFAGYPRRVVTNPLLDVFLPMFARLQHDRLRLSQTYYRLTSLTVRVGFGLSLLLILTAPELIRMLLGEHWAPMTLAFQLMVIYTLLDPLSLGASNLLMATGHPYPVARARAVQLFVFVPAVILLSRWRGIAGVALAADLTAVVGTMLLFHDTRRLVDHSLRSLLLFPSLSLVAITGLVLLLGPVWSTLPLWVTFVAKAGIISVCYTGLLWLTERDQLQAGWQLVWQQVAPSPIGLRITSLLRRSPKRPDHQEGGI